MNDVFAVIDPYRQTSYGMNPWTELAALHVYLYRQWFDQVRDILVGKITSGYRSQRVNRLVGGSKESRHLDGLAIDVTPRITLDIEKAAALVWAHALSKEIGPVRTIIREPGWIHVDWHALTEPFTGMRMLHANKTPGGNKTYTLIETYNPYADTDNK